MKQERHASNRHKNTNEFEPANILLRDVHPSIVLERGEVRGGDEEGGRLQTRVAEHVDLGDHHATELRVGDAEVHETTCIDMRMRAMRRLELRQCNTIRKARNKGIDQHIRTRLRR